MKRAGNYVLGLMDDSRTGARRARPRDRSFVSRRGGRDRRTDAYVRPHRRPRTRRRRWLEAAQGLYRRNAADARSRPTGPPAAPEPPVTFGRRRSDATGATRSSPAAAPKTTRIAPAFGSGPAGGGDSRGADRGFRAGLFCRRFVCGRTTARRCHRALNTGSRHRRSWTTRCQKKTAGFLARRSSLERADDQYGQVSSDM